MAESHNKQLEDELARYKRVMSGCSCCKAILALEEADATSRAVSSQRNAPRGSSPSATDSLKKAISTAHQDCLAQIAKQEMLKSQPEASSTDIDVVGPVSSLDPPSIGSREHFPRSTRMTARPPSRTSKQSGFGNVFSSSGNFSSQQTSTAPSPRPRPSFLRPSPSGHGTLSLDAERLNVNGTNDGKSGDKPPRWIRTVKKLLGEVPLGWEWQGSLIKLDRSMLAAVARDTYVVPNEVPSTVDELQNKDCLRNLVRGFVHRHHSDKSDYFQHILLVCLLKVLSVQNVPQASIVETLQIYVGDTSEDKITKDLEGVIWMNKLLDQLFFLGWRYRAIDLIIIWNRPIPAYASLSLSRPLRRSTSEYCISHLTKPEYFQGVQEIPNRVHDTIPWILKKELGDGFSYESICKALGYSDDYVLETKRLYSSDPPSPDSTSRASYDEGPLRNSPRGIDPSSQLDGALNLQEGSSQGRRLLPKDTNLGRRDAMIPPQVTESESMRRMIPDRSAKPIEEPRGVRIRYRLLTEDSNHGEVDDSISLAESAPGTQSTKTKRPLPDSPTSAQQSDNTTRRSQQVKERPSRRETGSPSRSGRKVSDKPRSCLKGLEKSEDKIDEQ